MDENPPQPPKSRWKGKLLLMLCLLTSTLWTLFRLETRLSEIAKQIEENKKQSSSLEDQLKSASAADKANQTQKAMELAKQAKAGGQLDLAKIYYISAISHSPDNVGILSAYAEAVLAATQPSTDDVVRLKSIVQVAMYQMAPDQIPKALAILERVRSFEERKGPSQTLNAAKPDLTARFRELTARPIDTILANQGKLQARVDELSEIADAADDQPSLDGGFQQQLAAELRKTVQTLTAVRTTALLDQYLGNLSTAADKDPVKALSIVQAAESAMAQLWSLDLGTLPDSLQKKIDVYPGKLTANVDHIAEVKSVPHIAQIQKEMQLAKSVVVGSGTPKIGQRGPIQQAADLYEGHFKNAQQAFAKISSETMRQRAEPQLTEMRDLIVSAKNNQFEAYQRWAVGVLSAAFKRFKNNEDIIKLFTENQNNNIDQSALSPETSRVFNDVIGKFLAKLSAESAVAVEGHMSNDKKMKLENF